VDRAALAGHQQNNDALQSAQTLKHAFRTDVSPILAMARIRAGGAADPVACYRGSGYRDRVASLRPAKAGASSSGIV
jgi:L-rhamnose isomerase/sugar isomerase